MALDRQILNLNFAQGLQTQPDPKQIQPGELLIAENVTFETPGQVTKSNGAAALTRSITGGGTMSASKVFADQEEGLFNGTGIKAYGYAGTTWNDRGYMPIASLAVYSTEMVNNTTIAVDAALNATNDQVCLVWSAVDNAASVFSSSQRYAVYRYSTGALMAHGSLSTTYGPIRVVATGNRFVVVRGTTTGVLTRYHEITCAAPQTVTDLGASGVANFLMADAMEYNGSVYVGGHIFGGGNATVESLSAANAKASRNTGEAASDNWQVGIVRNSAGVMVCYVNGTNLRAAVFNDALNATVTAATTLVALGAVTAGSGAIALGALSAARTRVVWSDDFPGVQQSNTMTTTDALVPSAPSVRSVYFFAWPFSRAWVDANDNLFCAFHWAGIATVLGDNPTYIAMLPDDNTNKSLVSVLTQEPTNVQLKSRSVTVADGVAVFSAVDAVGQTIAQTSATDVIEYAPRYLVLDQTARAAPVVAASGSIHIPGAQLWQSDGVSVVEHGFPILGSAPTCAQAAGGNIADGVYSYRYCYAWIDADGITHRSAPSPATSFTVAAGGGTARVNATCSPPNWTNRSQISIELYRTVASGTLYYLTSSMLLNPPGVTNGVAADFSSDASILDNRQLYTTDGTLENIEIPAPSIIAQHRDRIWGVSAFQPAVLWYSKPVFPGVPVEWSDAQTLAVPTGGEGITGIASLDDKLAVFTASRAFYVVGQGPGTNGLNNDLAVYPIVSASGCVSQASIGLIPEGIVVRSAKGFYLLSRSLELSYIGSPVELYNDASVYEARASYLSLSTRQARFALSGGTGPVLCYNYNQHQWSTILPPAGAPFLGFASYGGLMAGVQFDGTVYLESTSSKLMGATNVNIKVSTGWIAFAGLQNFERVRRLMVLFARNVATTGTLTVQVAYNFDDAVVQTATISAAQLQSDTQALIHLARQKCDSIRVTITENNSSGVSDAGVSLSGLAFEVGVKRGLRKLPATQTV